MIKRLEKLRVKLAAWIAPAGFRIVRPKARTVSRGGISGVELESSLLEVIRTLQNDLAENLQSSPRGCVASGPFAGMPFVARSSWGDLGPKLIGCYEEELHPAIERGLTRGWDRIMNIGCGEGYYAVGLARRLPDAKVLAHDISPDARHLTAELARASAVQDRLLVGGEVDHASLRKALHGAKHPFLFVDCEGAELALMDPDQVPALRGADMIIECHDFMDRSITAELMRRFDATHEIEVVREQSRDTRAIPLLSEMGCFEASLLVCEFRPERMQWLVLSTRAPGRC